MNDPVIDVIREELANHPGRAIAAAVAAVLFVPAAIVWMWVMVPAIEDVLAWAGIPR